MELVGAGLGDRGDRGAADLVVLGLVVGGDDLVLGDRQLRERIAAAGVLAGDAALEHVVLLADAVDEDVDAVGVLRAAAQLDRAVGAGGEHHARHGVGERQEVATALRQRIDLLVRDVGRDFRGLGFRAAAAPVHGHRAQVVVAAAAAPTGRFRLAVWPTARVTVCELVLPPARHIDAVGARLQAGQDVAAVGIGRRARRVAVGQVGGGDLGVGRRGGIGGDHAAQAWHAVLWASAAGAARARQLASAHAEQAAVSDAGVCGACVVHETPLPGVVGAFEIGYIEGQKKSRGRVGIRNCRPARWRPLADPAPLDARTISFGTMGLSVIAPTRCRRRASARSARAAKLGDIHAHGGQRRVHVARERNVVEARQRDVVRHARCRPG